jgi:hypothetical protein
VAEAAEKLESGRYALNQSLIVTIEQAASRRTMHVHRTRKFPITSCVRIGQTWKVGYTHNRRNCFGMLTEVPTR